MIFSPTGGLLYHAKAFRFRTSLWAEFRAVVRSWLLEWAPKEENLLIVGASGGYSLDTEFIRSFKRVVVVDPDPIARRVFCRLHRSDVIWLHEDYFSPDPSGYSISGLEELLSQFPNHAVLFSNFLGQLPLLDSKQLHEDSFKKWCQQLPHALQGRSWATYHDRISGPLMPQPTSTELWNQKKSQPNERLLEVFYRTPTSEEIELTDHLTADIVAHAPRKYFRWELTPGIWHLIEWVHQP